MGLNKELVGKEYEAQEYTIAEGEGKLYAIGYNEDLPLFTGTTDVIAPSMIGVKYTGASIAQAFFDPDLNVNVGKLVHGEQDMKFLATVKPGDKITTVGRISVIEEKSSGEIFVMETKAKNQNGEPVLENSSTFFIRGKKSDTPPPEKKEAPEEAAPPARDILFTQDMVVKENQTNIYAEGSGDYNPIHIDDDFAKKVGLPGIILQGLCSMAFCYKAVQDNLCGKDPLKIKRLQVRFAKPVLPKDTLTTSAWLIEEKDGIKYVGLEMVSQRGDVVIKNAVAEIAV